MDVAVLSVYASDTVETCAETYARSNPLSYVYVESVTSCPLTAIIEEVKTYWVYVDEPVVPKTVCKVRVTD